MISRRVLTRGLSTFPFDMGNISHEDDLPAVAGWVYGLNEVLYLREQILFENLPEAVPKESEEEYENDVLTSLSVIQGIFFPDDAEELFDTEFEDEEDPEMRLYATLYVMLPPPALEVLLEHACALEQERRERLMNRPKIPADHAKGIIENRPIR
ncbi:MAG: hypothetical protein SCH71_12840 [Desulfobulbaceae bacterium]|nr:hypothetical protein [Desulfobulbaceae bacterium]